MSVKIRKKNYTFYNFIIIFTNSKSENYENSI